MLSKFCYALSIDIEPDCIYLYILKYVDLTYIHLLQQ